MFGVNHCRLTNHPGIIKLKMFIDDLNIGVIEFADRGDLNGYLKHQQQPIGMGSTSQKSNRSSFVIVSQVGIKE